MKNKLLAAACVLSVAASAVALAAALSARARAAEPAPQESKGLQVIGSDKDTIVYHFENDGHSCFIASTRAGSGISLSCPR